MVEEKSGVRFLLRNKFGDGVVVDRVDKGDRVDRVDKGDRVDRVDKGDKVYKEGSFLYQLYQPYQPLSTFINLPQKHKLHKANNSRILI